MEYLQIKTLYLEVTHACNQSCKHCYLDGGIHQTIEEMSTVQIIHILNQFKEQKGTYIIITGGEPFMRKDLFAILDYIEKLEIPFTFASNSLALNNARLEKLSTYKYLALYFTSILGADAKKHRYITCKNSYEKTMNAIQYFTERNIPVYVQVTVADEFIDDMELIADQLLNFNNCTVKFTPIASFGINKSNKENANEKLLVKDERVVYFNRMVSKLKLKYPNKIEGSNILTFEQINEMIGEYKDKHHYSLENGFIAVRPNGDISFSCYMGNPFIFGKAYEDIKIPIDDKLLNYVELLRNAENMALLESKNKLIELDVATDNYIRTYEI